MPIIEIAKIQIRRGQENQGQVPQLAPGEMAWAEDTQNLYIGKRISEGANSDANSRILTDKDLGGIIATAFGYAQNINVSSTSTAYRFKNYLPFGPMGSTGTTYATTSLSFATKLDNWVSLTDFAPDGIWPPRVNYDPDGNLLPANDITYILQRAIGYVGTVGAPTHVGGGVVFQNGTTDGTGTFYNSTTPSLGPLAIKIPAGNWVVNRTVALPPFTTLVGEGAGMTVLTYSGINASGDPMFKTVDSRGVPYEGMLLPSNPLSISYMSSNAGENARNVTLKGLTLNLASPSVTTTATVNALVSLDNVSNVLFDNVYFGNMSTGNISTTTIIPGIIAGVQVRTTLAPVADVTQGYSDNIKFNDCWFNGMAIGISNTGSVNRIIVQNSKFTQLTNGIQTYNFASPSINDGVIYNNRFENIIREAITVGYGGLSQNTFITSQNNTFRNVGNEIRGERFQVSPVITSYDRGFQSVDDYFDRQHNALGATVTNVHWLSQNISAKSGASKQATVLTPRTWNTATTSTSILRLPMLSSSTYVAKINYSLDTINLSRKGELIMNIGISGSAVTPDGWADVSDAYTYFGSPHNQYVFTTDLDHSQPAIDLSPVSPYINGVVSAFATGTNSIPIALNTQDWFNTLTFFVPGATNLIFFQSDRGIVGHPTTFFDGTDFATLSEYTLPNSYSMTAQINKTVAHLTATGVQVVFTNPSGPNSLITWSSGVTTGWDYYEAHDTANAKLFNANFLSSATISVISGGTGSEVFMAPIDISNSYHYQPHPGYPALHLVFTPTSTYTLVAGDQVKVRLYPSQFYNYVSLNCVRSDVSTALPATIKYTVDILT